MKIRSIETFTTKEISIVRVRTDEGAEGYGQMAPYHTNISALVLHMGKWLYLRGLVGGLP